MFERIRNGINFANVVALLALFVALGGGAYAATKLKRNSVKSKHIKAEAVKGSDADESTFGTAPSAARATRATTASSAANASSVDGFTPEEFQFGDGFDDGANGVLADGATGGLELFEGAIEIECDSNPAFSYTDTGGDGGIATQIWVNGAHTEVGDGGVLPTADGNTTEEDSFEVHIAGGGGTVAEARISTVFVADLLGAGEDGCVAVFTTQENLGDVGPDATNARSAEAGGGRITGSLDLKRRP